MITQILVKDMIGKSKAGDIGLEIEIESTDGIPPAPAPTWGAKDDTSLRHIGIEYFTVKPILNNAKKFEKIKELTDQLNKYPIIKDSPRTSVHVHINVSRHTLLQVWTSIITYWLLDNVLIKYCGEDLREGNLFCLRAIDAEEVVKRATKAALEMMPFDLLRGDAIRYSSQNLNAISKFGSIEYRGMRGTTDPNIIDTWSTELYNIVHKSKRFSDPSEVMDTYLVLGAENFMRLILGSSFVNELVQKYDVDKLIKQNVGLLAELAYLHDWKKWEKAVIEFYAIKKMAKDKFATDKFATIPIEADWGPVD